MTMVRASMGAFMALAIACGGDGAAVVDTDASSSGAPDSEGPSTDTPTSDASTTAMPTTDDDDSSGSPADESSSTSPSTSGDDSSSTTDPATTTDATETDPTTTDATTTDPATTDPSDTDGGSSTSVNEESSSSDGGEVDLVAPLLTITDPRADRMTPVRRITVRGTVTDDIAVADLVQVTPDGDVAISIEADGSFAAEIALVPGANDIVLRASDLAGNTAEASTEVYFGHRVSVGNSQAATLRDGVLWTWGRNELGQLGNGSLDGSGYGDDPETSALPARYEVDVSGLLSIVTRQTFMIALRDDGHVMTWGSNSDGQLGYAAEVDCGSQGTSPCRREPTEVPNVASAIAVQAGFNHSMVLHEDGTVTSFGLNNYGQLGRATMADSTSEPGLVDGLTDVVQLAAGADSSFALTASGQVYGWGRNDQGQLGLGAPDGMDHIVPTVIPGVSNVIAVAAANTTVLALQSDGSVIAWGRNHAGQAGVGVGTPTQVLVPTPVRVLDGNGLEVPLTGIENIAADGFVSMAVTTDAQVYTWGLGGLGQLGQGYHDDATRDLDDRFVASPVAVEPGDEDVFDVIEIEVGAGGPALVLTTAGHLFGWGWSFRGSLGLEGAIDAWAYSAPLLVFAAD